MFDYVNEILSAFDKAESKMTSKNIRNDINLGKGSTKSSAASDNLFKIDEDCEKLQPSKAVEFHNLVAKTLYATKCARPNTCTAIAFLMTRVQAPDTDDWSKLVHLMKYLRGTRMLPMILSVPTVAAF
jgi:type I site-specific restriction endonuclease